MTLPVRLNKCLGPSFPVRYENPMPTFLSSYAPPPARMSDELACGAGGCLPAFVGQV